MHEYIGKITDYLWAQSWQIAVLVAAIAAASWILRNRSAHVRYLLWLIVLAKCVVPPLLTIPVAVLPQEEHSESVFTPRERGPTVALEPLNEKKGESLSARPATGVKEPTRVNAAHFAIESVRPWFVVLWIAGLAVLISAAGARTLQGNHRLRQHRRPLPTKPQSNVDELFLDFGIKCPPRVWLLAGLGQPFVWGLLRGNIYLPDDFVQIDDVTHRRSLLGHEICHILRMDAAINSLQVLVQAIFWFHPFVWVANGRIRIEREKCCDEMAVARLGIRAKEYTTAIVKTVLSEHQSLRPIPSLAVAGPVKDIEERVKTMLKPGKEFHTRPSLVASATILLAALLTVPTALMLTARAGSQAQGPGENPSPNPPAGSGESQKNDAASQPSGQRWTNSLGMVFVPVQGLDQVWFCIWETRVKDFEAFIKATGRDMGNKMMCFNRELKEGEWEGYSWRNPGFTQGPDHPAVGVNWEDAVAFCKWLNEKERKEGKLPVGRYRLPSDLEWSQAVGLVQESEKKTVYPWGKQWPPVKGAGNYADMTAKRKYTDLPVIEGYDDGYAETAPVGNFGPNPYGLYDMGGNVAEWCGYWVSSDADEYRALRGASWFSGNQDALHSWYRMGVPPSFASSPKGRLCMAGFRVVIERR